MRTHASRCASSGLSSVIGWTADGGALVFLGPGGACGSGAQPQGSTVSNDLASGH
jgi:hypothetical protein